MTTDKDWGEVILVVPEIANLHENPELHRFLVDFQPTPV